MRVKAEKIFISSAAATFLLIGVGNGVAFGQDLSAWGSYGPCASGAVSRTKASHVVEVGKSLANVPTDGIDIIECRGWTGMGPTNIVDCGGRPYTYCLLNDNDGAGNYVMLGVREETGILFQDNFDSGSMSPEWHSVTPTQWVQDGWMYTQSTTYYSATNVLAHDSDQSWTDYKVSLRAQFAPGTPTTHFSLLLRTDDVLWTGSGNRGNGYGIDFMGPTYPYGNHQHIGLVRHNYADGKSPTSLFFGDWNLTYDPMDIVVSIVGNRIILSVNGQQVFDVTDPNPLGFGGVGILTAWNSTVSRFDNFKVTAISNDSDNDGILDSADNCKEVANPDQLNTDGDAQGDACDTDDDNDTVLDSSDNCPLAVNADQANNDGDGQGDVCDDDDDNDTVLDSSDNCKLTANQDQADADADGQGDACDGDQDGDGVANAADNCPAAANADQADNDGDAQGDACDADDDNDTVPDAADNCPADANADQKDLDGDNIGDVCDIDIDGDGVNNDGDNCKLTANAAQEDTDADGAGDACDDDDDNDGVLDAADNCSLITNADQQDTDHDGQGDVCDGDLDGDGIANNTDNCPNAANGSQNDFDNDGVGDACDDDVDGDGVANSDDACGFTELNAVVKPAEGCSIAQLCPCEGPRGVTGLWKNHGQYVSCTAKSAESFVVGLNLITEAEKDAAVSAAAESDCGAKK